MNAPSTILHETAYVLEFNGDESNPLFFPVGRLALGGRTAPEWVRTMLPLEAFVDNPILLREIQQRLMLSDTPAVAFTTRGRKCLAFYEEES